MPEEKKKKGSRIKVSVIEDSNTPENDDAEKSDVASSEPIIEEKEEIKPEEEIKKEPDIHVEKDPNKIPFWVLFTSFLLGLSLGAGLIGGVFYYRSKVEMDTKNEEKPLPSSEIIEETATESAGISTDAEDLKIDTYSISILNGSGIKGEAAKVEALLVAAGYKEIQTGNADSYDFEETEIALREGLPDNLFDNLSEALSSYAITKLDNLDEDNKFDIEITVGSKKK